MISFIQWNTKYQVRVNYSQIGRPGLFLKDQTQNVAWLLAGGVLFEPFKSERVGEVKIPLGPLVVANLSFFLCDLQGKDFFFFGGGSDNQNNFPNKFLQLGLSVVILALSTWLIRWI